MCTARAVWHPLPSYFSTTNSLLTSISRPTRLNIRCSFPPTSVEFVVVWAAYRMEVVLLKVLLRGCQNFRRSFQAA